MPTCQHACEDRRPLHSHSGGRIADPLTSTAVTSQGDSALLLYIGSMPVQALIDTGAVISCISAFLLNKLPRRFLSHVAPQYVAVKGVGGETHRAMGCVVLSFRIGESSFSQTFHVLQGHHAMILGMDFMLAHKAVVDFGDGTLTLDNGRSLPLGPLSDRSSTVRTISTTSIPPRSVLSIPVRPYRAYDEPFLVEPTQSASLRSCQYSVIPTLAQITNDHSPVMCRLLNNTNHTVTVPARTVIGIARRVSPARILSVSGNADDLDSHESQGCAPEPPVFPELKNPNLSQHDRTRFEGFLQKHTDIFASDMTQIGCTHLGVHRIDTGTSQPQVKRFYRASPKVREEIDRQIEELLSCGFIEPSTSEWTSPVVLVKKKDGSYRFAVDYRQLNSVTRPMNFPMPRLEDIWDAIGASGAKVYSVIDLAGAFWQLPVHPDSQDKTAFVTQSGQYRWTRMPFGLRNAPVSFQRLMAEVFRGLIYKTMVVYCDDIICFSPNLDQHMKDLEEIFARLRQANLKAKPSKCHFSANSVNYLGHILSSEGVLPNPDKTKVVANFPVPKTQKQVRSFLGIANYYRRFIDGYSTITAPLSSLLKKGVGFVWSADCQEAFDRLKGALTSPPILAFPDLNRDFVVTTDASSTAIGYVLSQCNADGKEHPVCYGGRSLRGAEHKYGVSQLECLAAVEAVSAFHPYLSHRPFRLVTDHQALKYLMNFKHKNFRLCRWALALQGYTFSIEYKKGSANINADGLSRRPYSQDEGVSLDDNTIREHFLDSEVLSLTPVTGQLSPGTPQHFQASFEYVQRDPMGEITVTSGIPTCIDMTTLPAAQRECPDFKHVYAYLDREVVPESDQLAKKTMAGSDQFVLDGDILYHLFYPRSRGAPRADRMIKQMAVPGELRLPVLAQYHDGLLGGGHQGQDRTYHAIKLKYYWPGMYKDVCNYVQGCEPCQYAKRYFGFHPAPLQSMPIVDRFDRWHIDFLGPLKESPEGLKYILLVADSFSRWSEAFPTKSQDAKTVADILYREIFSRYGAPRILVSDRGRQFLSNIVSALCQIFKVKKVNTSPYHPQTNSTCERFNSFLEQSLRAYCDTSQEHWPKYIPGILMAYRSTPCTRSTTFSPYYLLFGRDMVTPLDSLLLTPAVTGSTQQYVAELEANLQMAQKIAKENVRNNSAHNKTAYDKKAKDSPFHMGQLVLLRDQHVKVGESSKLHRPYKGPYYIADVGPLPTYKLRDAKSHVSLQSYVHANRLKPYSHPCDRKYTHIDQNDPPEDVEVDTPSVVPELRDPDPIQPPADSATNSIDESDRDVEITDIVKAGKYQNRRAYQVRVRDKPGTIWLYDEDVPEVLKRLFHIDKTLSGKRKRKQRKKKQ